MKNYILAILLLSLGFQGFSQNEMPLSQRLKWWQDSKMGLFIHWGPVSLIGKGDQLVARGLWKSQV